MSLHMEDKVDDYLAGRLSGDDLDALEVELLEDVKLQEYVAEQLAFREALKSESSSLLEPSPPSLLTRVNIWLTSPSWAYAASITLVFLLPLVFLSKDSEVTVGAEQVIRRNVEFTRSSKQSELTVPSNVAVMLSIDAFGMNLQSPDFQLMRDGETIVHLKDLEVDEQQLVNVVLRPMVSGEYQIEISRGASEPTQLVLQVE